MDVHSAWQAWHLSILIGLGWLWWRTWAPLGAAVAAAVCVAGVALRDIDLRLCVAGMALMAPTTCPHITYSHTSLCVAGVALGDMDVHSAWRAWHLSDWAGSGCALGPRWAPWSPPPFA